MSTLTFSQTEIGSQPKHYKRSGYPTVFLGLALSCGLVAPAAAQNTCGMALQQLQMYVAQVNQIANFEYQQGIGMRCGGNPMCVQGMLQQLNFWYGQQRNMVNGYYMQIAQQCSSSGPVQMPQQSGDRMNERDVKTLDIDDHDKTARIRIPSTPQGFQ